MPEKINGRYKPKPDRRSRLPFHERPFVAWDGEGVNHKRKGRQHYVLFGSSAGNEIHDVSLNSWQCLGHIIEVGKANPDAIHVGFAFSYDVNFIIVDFSLKQKMQLKENKRTRFYDWVVEWYPGKWFRVMDVRQRISVRIYDVFSFFGCSFVSALQQYLGDEPDLHTVIEGKAGRDSFKYSELETIIRPYMRMELKLLVKLMTALREYLSVAQVRPMGWYGPGAVATSLLKSKGIGKVITRDIPSGVIEASQYAYFGGRFEQFYTGRYDGPVYSLDIRSAYPHALRLAPNISKGFWHHTEDVSVIIPFSLYHVRYEYEGPVVGYNILPMPLPYRDRRHTIHYPAYVEGWYWGVELAVAMKYHDVEIIEAWEFIPETDERPFAFVTDLYDQRMMWKAEGNPVQLAAKLGLNSIYGKLAQRIGWNQEKFLPPTWHQLEYAGFSTAVCRSMIYDVIMQNPLKIIAVETDGLYSTAPLNVELGKGLGQWELEESQGIVYVQSGVYWTRDEHGWKQGKVRGFGKNAVTVEDALRSLAKLTPVVGKTKRFASITGYLGKSEWLHWLTRDHEAKWGGGGKRIHTERFCNKCRGGETQLHNLAITLPFGGESVRHVLPWRDNEINPYQVAEDERNHSLDLSAFREIRKPIRRP